MLSLLPKSSVKPSVKSSAKPPPFIFATNAVIISKILLRPKFLLGARRPGATTFSTSAICHSHTECSNFLLNIVVSTACEYRPWVTGCGWMWAGWPSPAPSPPFAPAPPLSLQGCLIKNQACLLQACQRGLTALMLIQTALGWDRNSIAPTFAWISATCNISKS